MEYIYKYDYRYRIVVFIRDCFIVCIKFAFIDIKFQGLYPESHGIVDNNMYDEKINDTFHIYTNAKSNPAWWGGEPVSQ